ncbi:MAG: hypothetical protein WBA16_04615 [Nonlabens sp.]
MKRIASILVIFLTAFSMGSCEDDDPIAVDPLNLFLGSGTGMASVGSNDFILDKGIVFDYGANGDGLFNFDIQLVSGNLSLGLDGLNGRGSNLTLELNTETQDGIQDGTYTYGTDPSVNRSLTDAQFAGDYDFSLDNGFGFVDVEGGTVNVIRVDDTYNITFDLVLVTGEFLTGSYAGTLTTFTED